MGAPLDRAASRSRSVLRPAPRVPRDPWICLKRSGFSPPAPAIDSAPARLLTITSAIPARITASPSSAAGGGVWPRNSAASSAAPGTSSSSASETTIGSVVASRWLNTECPISCAVSVTSSSSPHCSQRVAAEVLARDQARDQQETAQVP